jgi:hypothetical protein
MDIAENELTKRINVSYQSPITEINYNPEKNDAILDQLFQRPYPNELLPEELVQEITFQFTISSMEPDSAH